MRYLILGAYHLFLSPSTRVKMKNVCGIHYLVIKKKKLMYFDVAILTWLIKSTNIMSCFPLKPLANIINCPGVEIRAFRNQNDLESIYVLVRAEVWGSPCILDNVSAYRLLPGQIINSLYFIQRYSCPCIFHWVQLWNTYIEI